MAKYAIAESKVIRRASLYSGGKTECEWIVATCFGEHDSIIKAKRAFIEVWIPEVKGQSDERIKIHFDAQRKNCGYYKVIKIA